MGFEFLAHEDRAEALGELHARPFEPVSTPRTVLNLTFMECGDAKSRADNFANWCQSHDIDPSLAHAKQQMIEFKDYSFSWENHLEFISFTWDCPYSAGAGDALFAIAQRILSEILNETSRLVSCVELSITQYDMQSTLDLTRFNAQSTSMSSVADDRALLICDFMPDDKGRTHFHIQNKALDLHPMGALCRRLLEIETYRMFALLGFCEAKRLSPEIHAVEDEIISLTARVGRENCAGNDADANRQMLDQLTQMGNDMEAISASSQYRLSATRAYYNIVLSRLKELDLQPITGFVDIQSYLTRRLAPAMATCRNIEDRITVASKKLARSANLLRTRVDIQLEAQNLELLNSMNKRAIMQYRLQTTVEGLSIAAVSYYCLGLLNYIFKGSDGYLSISAKMLTALAVPVVCLCVWGIVRHIRKGHQG